MVQLRVTKPRQHNYLPIFSFQLPLTSEGIMLITYHRTITNSITAYRRGPKFKFAKFNQGDVTSTLESLNPTKSSGWNHGAPPILLKKLTKAIALSLTSLYNECIESRKWPTHWKMGVWTPVSKTGDTQEIKNYTPITSLLTTDKVFDQLLCKQVTVKLHHIFSSRRIAYRNGHSCETTLLRLTEDWKLAIDRKELVCILSTDMSKAFDSLSHSLTLTKLEA